MCRDCMVKCNDIHLFVLRCKFLATLSISSQLEFQFIFFSFVVYYYIKAKLFNIKKLFLLKLCVLVCLCACTGASTIHVSPKSE